MKVNRFILIVVIVFNVVLLYGCFNIFSPLFSDPKDQDLSGLWDINFLVEMGNYYSDIGDYENARKFYSRALEMNPTNADALIGIANCEFFLVFLELILWVFTRKYLVIIINTLTLMILYRFI